MEKIFLKTVTNQKFCNIYIFFNIYSLQISVNFETDSKICEIIKILYALIIIHSILHACYANVTQDA